MVALVVQAIIILIVLGFLYWAWTKVRPIFAQFIAEPFMGLIDVALIILIGAIVVFYLLIPLIRMVPSAIKLGDAQYLVPLLT